MDLFFNLPIDDKSAGQRLPPEQVRFLDARIEPWPAGRKVRVQVDITPFAQPPYLEFNVINAAGEEIASTTIIENIATHLVLTLHLRGDGQDGPYTLNGRLFYPDTEAGDTVSRSFELPPDAAEAG
jgi:hypothetical protein